MRDVNSLKFGGIAMADNKIELTIAGLSIIVSTPEDAAFTQALAEEVDGDIRTIMRANEGASVTSAALLCAIDYLFEQKRAEKSSGNMRSQIKDYLAEAAAAKLECEEEHRRTLDLSAEIQTLRTQLTRLAVDSDNTITDKMKSQLTATTNELTSMRARVNELIVQNKSLNDKASAMSGLIAQRDEELVKISDENALLKTQLASRDNTVARQAQTIDELAAENRAVKEEVERLNSELDTLEKLILEEEQRFKELGELSRLAEASAESAETPESAETGFAPYEYGDAHEAQSEELPVEETAYPEPADESDMSEAESVLIDEEDAPLEAQAAEEPADEADGFTLEVEEEEEEPPHGYTGRATLSDPVPDDDDDSPRPMLFDYEASLADDSYEQLDVAMIAEVSPEEIAEPGYENAETEDYDGDGEPDEGEEEDEDEEEEENGEYEEDEPEDDEDDRPGEPDYTLRTDAIPEELAHSVEFDSLKMPSFEPDEIIEPLDDGFGPEHESVIDEMVARGADNVSLDDAEERTVHVERLFGDDDDDEPDKPDLRWTLNI